MRKYLECGIAAVLSIAIGIERPNFSLREPIVRSETADDEGAILVVKLISHNFFVRVLSRLIRVIIGRLFIKLTELGNAP